MPFPIGAAVHEQSPPPHPGFADADALLEYLRKRLARYEIPTEIAIVDAIPRTPSGKPDLSAIQRFFGEAAAHSHHVR